MPINELPDNEMESTYRRGYKAGYKAGASQAKLAAMPVEMSTEKVDSKTFNEFKEISVQLKRIADMLEAVVRTQHWA